MPQPTSGFLWPRLLCHQLRMSFNQAVCPSCLPTKPKRNLHAPPPPRCSARRFLRDLRFLRPKCLQMLATVLMVVAATAAERQGRTHETIAACMIAPTPSHFDQAPWLAKQHVSNIGIYESSSNAYIGQVVKLRAPAYSKFARVLLMSARIDRQ